MKLSGKHLNIDCFYPSNIFSIDMKLLRWIHSDIFLPAMDVFPEPAVVETTCKDGNEHIENKPKQYA